MAARIRFMLEIAVFAAIVAADAAGLVPITQTIFLIPLIWISLRLQRESFANIGFSIPDPFWRHVGIGIVAGLVLELVAVYLTTPAISNMLGVEPDYSELAEIQGNLPVLLIFLALSWVIAAFGEEICFRGFLMNRIAGLLGNGRAAWIVSLIFASIIFGWGHTEQGVAGWIQEGLAGFWLGCLFLLSKRNLTVPIVAHGVSNTLALVLIYFGNYPGLD